MIKLLVLCLATTVVLAQQHQGRDYNNYQNEVTTPHPRNYHPPAPVHYVNIGQDLAGDYKFGYDTGKGPLGQSFREETRLPDGTVKGAYGIMDSDGKQRIIRYTAGKAGFTVEGDIGPNGAAGVAPGPAPQPVANPHAAPQYQAPAQQYRAPAPQYAAPAQQYAAPAQQYAAPAAAPAQQYRPSARAARQYDDGQWDPKKDDPYYVEGPSFIDVERLSYNIGTSHQGDTRPRGVTGFASSSAQQYQVPAQQYRGQVQQYRASAPQYSVQVPQYTAPSQQYMAPAPQYTAPASQYAAPVEQYRPSARAARQYDEGRYDDGQWGPKKDNARRPVFIDVERLSYNIGTAQQG